jgi:O-antigen biosynthesis protein
VSVPTLAIVPTYLRAEPELEVLLKCLVSLQASAPDAQVLVVDDHSPDAELARLAELAAGELGMAFVRKDENSGFSATVNVGLEVARASGADAVLVNADIEFTQAGWLDVMLRRCDRQGRPAAVVGARLLYPNGLLQHAGVYFSLLERAFAHRFLHGPGNLPEALMPCLCPVTGALQLIRHETLMTVGLYDETFGLGFEDVDYCLRVFDAGLDCIYEPGATAIHHESLFRGNANQRIDGMQRRSTARLREKHLTTDMAAWTRETL